MIKVIIKYLELQIQLLLKELEIAIKTSNNIDSRKVWDLETGREFNNLVSKYAISEDELLSISETVAKFVTYTRITDIDKYLFDDKELTKPKLIKG